jgi:hypothetical protein
MSVDLSCKSSNIVYWTELCILFSAMSGVKWDRNLGKKCKSGVSIRKRKAELE